MSMTSWDIQERTFSRFRKQGYRCEEVDEFMRAAHDEFASMEDKLSRAENEICLLRARNHDLAEENERHGAPEAQPEPRDTGRGDPRMVPQPAEESEENASASERTETPAQKLEQIDAVIGKLLERLMTEREALAAACDSPAHAQHAPAPAAVQPKRTGASSQPERCEPQNAREAVAGTAGFPPVPQYMQTLPSGFPALHSDPGAPAIAPGGVRAQQAVLQCLEEVQEAASRREAEADCYVTSVLRTAFRQLQYTRDLTVSILEFVINLTSHAQYLDMICESIERTADALEADAKAWEQHSYSREDVKEMLRDVEEPESEPTVETVPVRKSTVRKTTAKRSTVASKAKAAAPEEPVSEVIPAAPRRKTAASPAKKAAASKKAAKTETAGEGSAETDVSAHKQAAAVTQEENGKPET